MFLQLTLLPYSISQISYSRWGIYGEQIISPHYLIMSCFFCRKTIKIPLKLAITTAYSSKFGYEDFRKNI